MNHEFRGKSIDSGEWIAGNYIYDTEKETHYIVYNYKGSICVIEVEEKTVGQYIGLKDKNCKKIYEGDIMLHDDSEWGYGGEYDKTHDGYSRTLIPYIDDILKDYPDSFIDQVQSWEVIGNKTDNPKLLRTQ